MPDEVRKKGPRGVIELTDCWISPSNEDDVTFTVQTGGGDAFKLRAFDAKERQKWIDKLRACSGTNAANVYVSSLPISKTQQTNTSTATNLPNEINIRSPTQRNSQLYENQHTLKELKEVIRCVEVNQREFVETIYTLPDDISLNLMSKNMLLLRSISQSCIGSLQDSLTILTRRRMPENEILATSVPSTPLLQSSIAVTNTSNKQSSQSINNSTSGKSSSPSGLSAQSNPFAVQNKNPSLAGFNQSNENSSINKDTKNHVHIDLNVECHLPCIVFRLLDYPAVSIPYFDQWQIEDFHNLKKDYPNISWRQLLSDQFYELRSANGKFNFNRGKSCLFKIYFKTLYTHLLNVPLFILLIDQINDSHTNKSHFIGSCNVKLNELIEILNQSIINNGYDIPLVEQQTFHCILFNLMGTKIGTCHIAVRLCHYGTTILTHLPMLDDEHATKTDKKVPITTKEQITEPLVISPPTDTIVKHIHFVNEKKDVGLQLSRSDLPSSSINNKSAQTRWTSTKTRPIDHHHSKRRYLRTIEDPSFDDPTVTFYRPPPLYYNSDSDFLQMITPASTEDIEQAKENRLSYLASIPIVSFDDESNIKDDDDGDDENEKRKLKRKSTGNVRFNLSSSLPSKAINRTTMIPKKPTLAKDFLHNFPLLRSLVEEALALQQHQYDISTSVRHVMFDDRPHSAVQQKQNSSKQIPVRPKSAMNVRTIRTKSVIVTRNIINTRRLYPPSSKTNKMIVTKNDVRDLVDRLSKPKFNKRVEREIASIDHDLPTQELVIKTPRISSKQTNTTRSTNITRKPPPSYGTTRAHRLMAELSRARRAGIQPQKASSPKSQTSPKIESASNSRTPSSSPQILNTGTVSRLSLLNKVDVDTPTIQKTNIQRTSLEVTPENTGPIQKSPLTTSQDVTLKLNQTITKITFSTPESTTMPQHNQENDQRNDDLTFSITDITDYFTDGGESSTRPSS
ncbi:unnamed protein product [Rotaria sp. Silwood1]|nr:unnamed protein product [Rotaria sp. Silwood1]CAF4715317.1 unnamed protein product [Rotaria sp. Silwood1]